MCKVKLPRNSTYEKTLCTSTSKSYRNISYLPEMSCKNVLRGIQHNLYTNSILILNKNCKVYIWLTPKSI